MTLCFGTYCNVAGAFHTDYMKSDMHVWIKTFFNRRNRLGQKFVERLVRTHTNLKLEQRLEMYVTDRVRV